MLEIKAPKRFVSMIKDPSGKKGSFLDVHNKGLIRLLLKTLKKVIVFYYN